MYKILLIEDDPDIRDMLLQYFRLKGSGIYKLSCAANGQNGLSMLYENKYDLLLLDINLPDISGFEICKDIRSKSDIPIMFITARLAQEDILRG